MFGRTMEDGRWNLWNYAEIARKIDLNARNRGGVGEIFIPSATVSLLGQRAEDGRRKLWNYEETQKKIGLNGSNKGGAECIDPVSFRRRRRMSVDFPRTSAACVGRRWKMEAVEL